MQQLGAPQGAQIAGLQDGSAGTDDAVVGEEAIVPVDDVEPPTKSDFARAFKVSALPTWMGPFICVKLMSNTCCKKHQQRELSHKRKSPGPNGVTSF